MTGYGKATGTIGNRRYTVEVRSLNGKQLDLSVRMPSAFREREMALRKQVGAEIIRGKSDLSISYEQDESESRSQLNGPVIRAYLEEMRLLAQFEELPLVDPIGSALRLPDAVQQAKEEVDEQTWSALDALVQEALSAFNAFREQEGRALEADFRQHLDSIAAVEADLDPLLDARLERVKSRIHAHLEDVMQRGRIDENRFEQEVLFYVEKMDVSEERVRLRAHLALFREILEGEPGQGKKLGFVAQEIGREVNTLGSKANDAEIQRLVVGMKDDLEKIKEQVLNVL
jgi:uncharacterized protein (TIGR00255 family)